MARKKNDQLSEKERKVIIKRICEAFDTYKDKHPGINQKELSKKINISESTLSRLLNSESLDNYITLNNLIKISKVLNVNMDYLIGKTSSQTIEIENRAISEKLKLTDHAINNLLKISESDNINDIETLNILLESSYFIDIIDYLYKFLYSETLSNGYIFYTNKDDEIETLTYLENEDIENMFLSNIESHIREIKNEKRKINNDKKY